MPVLSHPNVTPARSGLLGGRGVAAAPRSACDEDPSESLWTRIDEAFPASATIGVSLVPWVVDLAAHLSRARRLRHVAFVASIAFGGVRDAARVAPPLVDIAYRSVAATAGRVANEASRPRIWDDWEARCLFAACERIVGRLRRAGATDESAGTAGLSTIDGEHELARWLLADIPVHALPMLAEPALARGQHAARCAPIAAPKRSLVTGIA